MKINSSRPSTASLLLALALLAGTTAARGNLIIDGDFENASQ